MQQHSHEAIIPPETFELVQRELARRNGNNERYSGVDIFASRIVCGECGAFYGAKVWHSNDVKYRRVIFRCNRKYDGDKKCATPHITVEQIHQLFTIAINRLIGGKREILANLNAICDDLYDITSLETERDRLQAEMVVTSELVNQMIAENAHVALNQADYQRRYSEIAQRYDETRAEYDAVCGKITDTLSRCSMLHAFIDTLKHQTDVITEFDPTLWGTLLDHMTVNSKDDIRFTFRDGTEIKV